MLWLSSCCHRNSYVTGHVKWFTWVRFPRGDLSYGLCVCVSVCACECVCLPSHPHQDYLLTEFSLLNQKIPNPSSFSLWIYNQPLSPFLSLPHHLEYITIYLYFLWLLPCLSFNPLSLMSVPVSGSCSARQRQDTFTTMWVCLCPFPSVCASLCVAEWQKVTVSNGPDLKVGVLACGCVLGLGRLVCVCVSSHNDGDSWEGTGMCRIPFRPDAPVTSWPCSLPLNFPSHPPRGEGWNQSPIHRGGHPPLATDIRAMPQIQESQDQRNNCIHTLRVGQVIFRTLTNWVQLLKHWS